MGGRIFKKRGLSRPGSESTGREEANFLFPKGEFFHGELHKGLAIGQAEKGHEDSSSLGLQQRNFPVPAALEGALEVFLANAEAEYGKAAGRTESEGAAPNALRWPKLQQLNNRSPQAIRLAICKAEAHARRLLLQDRHADLPQPRNG